jgi:AraC-like DNA-binding protein
VVDVRCWESASPWSDGEPIGHVGLILARRGRFKRRLGRRETLIDPSTAYFERPETEQQIAHPVGDGDVCTWIRFAPAIVVEIAGDSRLPDDPVLIDGRIDLAHRRLVARIRAGTCRHEADERAFRLLGSVLSSVSARRVDANESWARPTRRRLVDTVRDALHDGKRRYRLSELAALCGYSPYHVSRVFSEETGTTITGYRNRRRVGQVLAALEEGEQDLARLAADLEFADQAHMTRVIRREVGDTPGRLRELLANGEPQEDPRRRGRIA